MSETTGFSVDVFQNEYLAEGAREVDAIVTVTATQAPEEPAPPPAAVEVIVVDCSGSMHFPRTKIIAARQAAKAAIDTLRDGVLFAVIAGNEEAALVHPADERLQPAGWASREAAKRAIDGLRAGGGTAIGRWLLEADRIFARHPGALRHAILLTDGKDESETPEELAASLAVCAGHFACDCRGVGADWNVEELRRIASTLLGTADMVADPADLVDDFRAMAGQAMGKRLADVALRLWTPQGATLRFLKQVAPTLEDLTGRRRESGPLSGDYPTGSWGEESRDYHLRVEVSPGAVGEEMLAGRARLVALGADGSETLLGQGLVRAIWTDDGALSTQISPAVAHYTGQAELAEAIREGLEARRAGDVDIATAKLGRAVALAHRSGNEDTAKLLARVVDIVDVDSGTVRLKSAVEDVDEMTLDVRSTKTVRVRRRSEQ